MSLIEISDLHKVYKQAIRKPGLVGAIRHLIKSEYREEHAVRGIDLTIEAGESIGYIGPNGAGKSTSIKIMTGILKPTRGEIQVGGLNPFADRMRYASRIGVVFGHRSQLWWDIPILESFKLLKDIYRIPASTFHSNMNMFADLLGLGEFLHLTSRKLSLGQRMRADICAAFLHDPKVVFLDEPTIGLDIAVKERIRTFIREVNHEKDVTIILTTHDLTDIEQICKRLIIIDHGKIIYDGTIERIKDKFARTRTIHVTLGQEGTPIVNSISERLPDVQVTNIEGVKLSLTFDRFKYTAGDLLKELLRNHDIVDFHIDEPNIEEIIKRVYGHSLTL